MEWGEYKSTIVESTHLMTSVEQPGLFRTDTTHVDRYRIAYRQMQINKKTPFIALASLQLFVAALLYFSVPVQLQLGVSCSSTEGTQKRLIFMIKLRLIVCLGMLTCV